MKKKQDSRLESDGGQGDVLQRQCDISQSLGGEKEAIGQRFEGRDFLEVGTACEKALGLRGFREERSS